MLSVIPSLIRCIGTFGLGSAMFSGTYSSSLFFFFFAHDWSDILLSFMPNFHELMYHRIYLHTPAPSMPEITSEETGMNYHSGLAETN